MTLPLDGTSNRPRKHRPGDPKKAVAYLRASTDEQTLTPEVQRAQIEAWALREGVSVVAWCLDPDLSGDTPLNARPGCLDALSQLRHFRAGLLVIQLRDRLAREVVEAGLIERAVFHHGARVVSADGIANGEDAGSVFMRTILDGAAAYEKSMIRQRTKDAMKALRAKGYRAGEVPFGYSADPETGQLAPHPQEQATIARTYALRREGRSLRAIVAQLDQEGYRSRAGRPLALTQVARLARPFKTRS